MLLLLLLGYKMGAVQEVYLVVPIPSLFQK